MLQDVGFFKELYGLDFNSLLSSHFYHGGFPALQSTIWQGLETPVKDEEIYLAVKKMGSLKAPGIDGFQPVFYQNCWRIVGKLVIELVKRFFVC